VQLALDILPGTAVTIFVAHYGIAAVNVSGIFSILLSDAYLIRQRCLIHLIQPEWASNQPDMLLNWTGTEMKARFGLTALLWLFGISDIICHWSCELIKQ